MKRLWLAPLLAAACITPSASRQPTCSDANRPLVDGQCLSDVEAFARCIDGWGVPYLGGAAAHTLGQEARFRGTTSPTPAEVRRRITAARTLSAAETALLDRCQQLVAWSTTSPPPAPPAPSPAPPHVLTADEAKQQCNIMQVGPSCRRYSAQLAHACANHPPPLSPVEQLCLAKATCYQVHGEKFDNAALLCDVFGANSPECLGARTTAAIFKVENCEALGGHPF